MTSPNKTSSSRTKNSPLLDFTPLALRMARVENVSLETLRRTPGSALGGRISGKDVLSFMERDAKDPALETGEQLREMLQLTPSALAQVRAFGEGAPPVLAHLVRELDVTELLACAHHSSTLAFVIQAAAGAAMRFPGIFGSDATNGGVNCLVVGDGTESRFRLITDADGLNWRGIAQRLESTASNAGGDQALTGRDLVIHHLPGLGADLSLLRPPGAQAVMLSLGSPAPKAVVRDGGICVRDVCLTALSYDATRVDEWTAAHFFSTVEELLIGTINES